jgi:hypothetical protein
MNKGIVTLGRTVRALLLPLWSEAASAQIQGVRPEGHLNLGFHGDVGLGFRVDIPIVPSGLLDTANDELALSPGADLSFGGDSVGVGIPVALQWNFYLTRDWSVFPELGLAVFFSDDDADFDILVALGARYHMSLRNALFLRIGWPFGLQFGVTF